MIGHAGAAPATSVQEDRYLATRDAAITRISPLVDAGTIDDAAKKLEDAARTELLAQMETMLGERRRPGFGPAILESRYLLQGQ